jgi:hypothetical protein
MTATLPWLLIKARPGDARSLADRSLLRCQLTLIT